MYKFTSHVANAKLILVRRKLGDGSTAAFILMHEPRRGYPTITPSNRPKEPCEAKPLKKSNKFFWGMVGATVLTGAAVVYAKNSRDARNWLETNVPWANDFVALVYQENTTYWGATKNQIGRTAYAVRQFMFGKDGVTPPENPARSEQDIDKDAQKAFFNRQYELPPPTLEPLYVEVKVMDPPEVETQATLVQTEQCEPPKPPPIKVTKDLVEIEHEMHENTKIAMDKYKEATKFSIEYNKALARVIESSLEDLDKKFLSNLQGARASRDTNYEAARTAGAKARCAIEILERMIKAGVQAPPDSIAATVRYLKQFRSDLTEAENKYKKELENSVLSERYWDKVEQARIMFKDELQALFPGIDVCAKKLDLRGDIDLLLTYTLKVVQSLQNEIAKLQTVRELKINRAIECNDEKAIIEAKIDEMMANERLKMEREYLKKSLQIQADANKHTREELKKQYEYQQEIMQDMINRKEKEIMSKFSRAVSEKVEAERVIFKKELAAMAGKLEAIEQTLKKRAASEAEARRSQSLWAAAEALLAATRRAGPLVKIDNELNALAKAGQFDLLVQTILRGIPDEIREKGVVTEKALRDRFEVMEQNAVKVALIGREGASLPVYFLSWLQSKLLFQKFAEIPKDELENLPTDFTKLDTFDIMHRARYHMEQGDMGVALRYVNLLQGAARAASRAWAEAARRHLEVRQAAEAVMTHASVAGMLYL